MLQKAAEHGLGLAICRTAAIKRALESNLLVALSRDAIDQDWAYTIKIAAGREIEPEVQIVTAWLNSLSVE